MQDITSDTKVVKKKKHWGGHYYLLSPWFLFVYSLAACIDHTKIFLQILNFTSSTTPMCRQICTSVYKLSLLLSNSYSLGTKWLLLQISRDFIFFIFKERSVYFFFPLLFAFTEMRISLAVESVFYFELSVPAGVYQKRTALDLALIGTMYVLNICIFFSVKNYIVVVLFFWWSLKTTSRLCRSYFLC